jgi:microcystin-dependent protein
MAQPYVGEIRLFAGNFAPLGWHFCDGQLLSISENETLFQLIGTTYGGDGYSTFALPDMRGRLPMHQGNGFILAETIGVEEVTLTVQQIPQHTHSPSASLHEGTHNTPAGNVWAAGPSATYAAAGAPLVALRNDLVRSNGGNQPHENRMPYLGLNFIISLFGIFPSPT